MWTISNKYLNLFWVFLWIYLLVFSACDKDTPLVERGDPEILQGLLSSNRTLKNKYSDPDAPDYLVKGVYQVLYASLKIEAGVVIHFEEDAGLEIGDDAALQIKGSENNRVVLTGTSPIPGFWRGILIQTNLHCSIAYTDLHHAGRVWWEAGQQSSIWAQGKLLTSREMSLDIHDCLITNSPQFGVFLGETLKKVSLQRNVFKQHGLSPVVCPTYLIPDIDVTNSDYRENGHNGIFLINGPFVLDGVSYGNNGTYGYIDEQPASWKPFPDGGSYRGIISMRHLTLNAGVIIEIPPGKFMSILNRLTASGTAEQNVILRNIPGHDNFVRINLSGPALSSTLEHCVISNGGCCDELFQVVETPANIELSRAHDLFLSNCLIQNSEGCGIFIYPNIGGTLQSEVTQTGCTFLNNASDDICYW